MNVSGTSGNFRAVAQKRKPARLYLRTRKGFASVWVIRHGSRMLSTGCREHEIKQAHEFFDRYISDLELTAGRPVTPRPMQRDGHVYFISCDRGSFPVKIGWTTDIKSRLQTIQCALPYRAVLLALTPATLGYEQQLHATFGKHRLEGEWFERTDDLMRLIDSLADRDAACALQSMSDRNFGLAPQSHKQWCANALRDCERAWADHGAHEKGC